MPFGLAISSEYVFASSYGVQLSDVVAAVVSPYSFGLSPADSTIAAEDVPGPAMFVPEEPDAEAIAEPPQSARTKANRKKSGQSVAAKGLPAIHVSAETVLRIANSGTRPVGKPVTAEGKRPAGVQVFGASSLGIGVRDGDVITRVSGVPVTSANQVIALVIAARGARQKSVSAQMYRGQRSYALTVEQPYIAGAQEPQNSNSSGTAPETR